MMRGCRVGFVLTLITVLAGIRAVRSETPDPAAVERGRINLTQRCFLPPGWSLDVYKQARSVWNDPAAPDPDREPEAYAGAFMRRYGLHPAPYPNDGLPMGLRRAVGPGGKDGIQLDCMLCHGGSLGGTSYVGLGNTQLDLTRLLDELTRADGKRLPISLFTLNSVRGLNNAGQVDVALLSMRNPDLSFRNVPLITGAWLPELDTPPWWHLARKHTKYYDGRTDVRATRSNMQFFLGDLSLAQFQELEPKYQDIDAYLNSLRPPRYPFSIDEARAQSGRAIFETHCARCHGTYGPDGHYPNKLVPIAEIGTDPARLNGLSDRFVAHYNASWFGQSYPVERPRVGYQAPPLDGIWATAPYLHNGSIPTVYHLLKSAERPKRFRRAASTDLSYFDRDKLGWRFDVIDDVATADLPAREARTVYDTSRWGLGNQGHTFGDGLSDDERKDLIEYLKTL